MVENRHKLTKSSQCPCGNPAIKYKGGAYVCENCDAIESELSKYLDNIARRHSDRIEKFTAKEPSSI